MILLVIVIIVSLMFAINSYFTIKEQQLQIANDNYYKWEMIYRMTQLVDEYFAQAEKRESAKDLTLYVNRTSYYSGFDSIKPRVDFNFFALYYDMHFRNLIEENVIPEPYQEAAFNIFIQMNTEMYKISKEVLEISSREEERNELILENSKLYKTTEEKIDDFYEKYKNLLDDFYKTINSQD